MSGTSPHALAPGIRPSRTLGRGAARRDSVRVRTFARRDLPAAVALEQAVHGRRAWSSATFRSEVARDDRDYLVAVTGRDLRSRRPDRVTGYAGSADVDGDLHVTTVVVSPRARRQGIASRLVSGLLRRGAARGMTAATLEVGAGNVAARELYRRFGFVPVGVRPGYYAPDADGAPAEDAVIMWLHDLDDFGGNR